MISASDARNQAENVLSATDEKLIKELDSKVRAACEKGQRSISVSAINYRVQKKLKELGYTYKEDYDQRDNTSWQTLSW